VKPNEFNMRNLLPACFAVRSDLIQGVATTQRSHATSMGPAL
jgi:hypothetical protein